MGTGGVEVAMRRTVGLGACFALGCTGGDPSVPTWREDIAPLVRAECVSCHYGDLPGGGLDLAIDPYGAIVDAPSLQAPMLLVTPGDSLHSYLWHKVNGSQSLAGGAGTSMPQDAPLADDEIALFAAWIDGGAPR